MLTSKIKQMLLLVSGQGSHLKRTVSVEKRWYGNQYGGFYACPVFLNDNSIVYSFGIGEDISFDQAIIENHNCRVFGFDPTPKSINWIKKQKNILSPKFEFNEYGIGGKSELVDFFLPRNTEHVSGSFVKQTNVDDKRKVNVELKSFSDIAKELGHQKVDICKMDIEGAEYAVLGGILGSSVRINQILIEFHDRFFENGRSRTIDAIRRLKENGYELFGVSASFEEVSFIKKDLLTN